MERVAKVGQLGGFALEVDTGSETMARTLDHDESVLLVVACGKQGLGLLDREDRIFFPRNEQDRDFCRGHQLAEACLSFETPCVLEEARTENHFFHACCDLRIHGHTDLGGSVLGGSGFGPLPNQSRRRRDQYDARARKPFDREAPGTVESEGSALPMPDEREPLPVPALRTLEPSFTKRADDCDEVGKLLTQAVLARATDIEFELGSRAALEIFLAMPAITAARGVEGEDQALDRNPFAQKGIEA